MISYVTALYLINYMLGCNSSNKSKRIIVAS